MSVEVKKESFPIDAGSLEVEFPYPPYDVQRVYVDKLVRALEESKHALLESPTGTGKTMCLLTGALAFQNEFKKRNPTSGLIPQIVYASRTTKQLSQAVQELRKIEKYKPRVSLLSGRKNSCVHPRVSRSDTDFERNSECAKLLTGGSSCSFKNNTERFQTSNIVADIESMNIRARSDKFCPYYYNRQRVADADIVFLPYNYLFNASTRRGLNIRFKNAVVIVDEAHNVERACEDTSSTSFNRSLIAACVSELRVVLAGVSCPSWGCSPMMSSKLINSRTLATLSSWLRWTENALIPIDKQEKAFVETGEKFLRRLERQGIIFTAFDLLIKSLEETSRLYSIFKTGSEPRSLKKLVEFLRILNPSSELSQEDLKNASKIRAARDFMMQRAKTYFHLVYDPDASKEHVKFMCHSPAVSFQDLCNLKVRSVILTSGTLAPLAKFEAQLGIVVDHKLESPHVVDPKACMVCVLTKGPSNLALNSSYANRSNKAYQLELGNALVNIAKTSRGGMLVFFSSYAAMETCAEAWQAEGSVWRRLTTIKNRIEKEPRNSKEMDSVVNRYKKQIDSSPKRGAVFLAVCGGKASEGMNFSDDYARVVCVTGLPFPPRNDPKVVNKRVWLDEAGASGRAWYSDQANSKINQACGRVVRHSKDHGLIVLMDERFKNFSQQLSKWLRPRVVEFLEFKKLLPAIVKFFKNNHNVGSTKGSITANALNDASSLKIEKKTAPRFALSLASNVPAVANTSKRTAESLLFGGKVSKKKKRQPMDAARTLMVLTKNELDSFDFEKLERLVAKASHPTASKKDKIWAYSFVKHKLSTEAKRLFEKVLSKDDLVKYKSAP